MSRAGASKPPPALPNTHRVTWADHSRHGAALPSAYKPTASRRDFPTEAEARAFANSMRALSDYVVSVTPIVPKRTEGNADARRAALTALGWAETPSGKRMTR